MVLRGVEDIETRFDRYVNALMGVIGHEDRAGPLRDYCLGLVMPKRARRSRGRIASVAAALVGQGPV